MDTYLYNKSFEIVNSTTVGLVNNTLSLLNDNMQKATNIMILFQMIRGATSNISIDKRQTLAIEIFN